MSGLTQYTALANEAAAAVERREARYPALIKAGKIPADQAAQEIRVWRAIAADWHWVVTFDRREVDSATHAEKIAAIEESLRRTERALRKAIAACDDQLRRAWAEMVPIAVIADRFGDGATAFLEAWHQHWLMDDLLKWARRDDPASERLPISWYVEQERQRTARKKAA